MSRKKQFNFMPRILSREGAAFYLGICPNSFDKLHLPKISIIGKRVGYDVQDIDKYIEMLKNGDGSPSDSWGIL
jgi:hypothetical protein